MGLPDRLVHRVVGGGERPCAAGEAEVSMKRLALAALLAWWDPIRCCRDSSYGRRGCRAAGSGRSNRLRVVVRCGSRGNRRVLRGLQFRSLRLGLLELRPRPSVRCHQGVLITAGASSPPLHPGSARSQARGQRADRAVLLAAGVAAIVMWWSGADTRSPSLLCRPDSHQHAIRGDADTGRLAESMYAGRRRDTTHSCGPFCWGRMHSRDGTPED